MRYGSSSPNLSQHAYHDHAAYELPPIYGRKRVFLVAIQADQAAAACAGTSPLQRVHVMVVRPGERAKFDSPVSLLAALPEITPGVIPAYRVGGDLPLLPRPVQGEILWNDEGRFFERLGPQVRLLQNLVSGPRGEILELVPSGRNDGKAGPAIARGWSGPRRPEKYESVPVEEHSAQTRGANASPLGSFPGSTAAGYRKLLPEPGSRCLVRFGDFKPAVAPQLAHPERLRDSHRLPCCVQVYEVTQAQRMETLAAAVLGDVARVEELQPLSSEAATALGLNAHLPARTQPRYVHGEPGVLLPCDRLFRLQLEGDPTADEAAYRNASPQGHSEATQAAPSPAGTGNHAAGATGARKSIPERYLKPWEFKLSREEAAYDLRFEAANRGLLKSFFRRLKNCFGGRNDFRRWQAFLWGKNAEDQLWGVRPQEGSLSDPAIRDWAQKTLELAGYNSASMLPEWEIFWRRKGVCS